MPVQAGRGYSFTVPVDPDTRAYLSARGKWRTPYQGALRVSGLWSSATCMHRRCRRVGVIVAGQPSAGGCAGPSAATSGLVRARSPRRPPRSGRCLEASTWPAAMECGDWRTAGDRPVAGRTDHHRQATRSPARLTRCAEPAARPKPTTTPPVNHLSSRVPESSGRRWWSRPPLTTTYSTEGHHPR